MYGNSENNLRVLFICYCYLEDIGKILGGFEFYKLIRIFKNIVLLYFDVWNIDNVIFLYLCLINI